MKSNIHPCIAVLAILISGASPDHGASENVKNTNIIEQTYLENEVQIQSETQIRWKRWKETENWRSYCASLKDYSPDCDAFITAKDSDLLLRRQDDLLEKQGESELMMMISVGVGFLAGIGVAVALWQNAEQTSDVVSLKSRVSSLETDQTSICTTVKSFQSAQSGKTVALGTYGVTSSLEAGYLVALAAVTAPTCS